MLLCSFGWVRVIEFNVEFPGSTTEGLRRQLDVNISLPRLRSQTETRFVQTKMNARRGCRTFKIRRSGNTDERTMVWTWTHDGLDMNARWSGHERTMVWWTHDGLDMNARKSGHERTKIFRAFMSRLSCVHVQTIVCSPDFRAFMSRQSCGHVQTIVRSCPDHRAFMSRFSCVHQAEKDCWGAVQILEAEDREVSKTPKIRIFKVFFYVRYMSIFILIGDIAFFVIVRAKFKASTYQY